MSVGGAGPLAQGTGSEVEHPAKATDRASVARRPDTGGRRRRRGRVYLDNEVIYDLSPPAAGVLARLLSRPKGAPAGYRAVMVDGFGKVASLKALTELDTKGYRHRFRVQDAAGRFAEHVYVYPRPTSAGEAAAELERDLAAAADRAADIDSRHRESNTGAPVYRAQNPAALLRTTRTSLRSVLEDGSPARVRAARCTASGHEHNELPCRACASDHHAGEHDAIASPSCHLCREPAAWDRAS